MKSFRKIVGGLLLIFIACFFIFANYSSDTKYQKNLESGKIDGIKVGDTLRKVLEFKGFCVF